MKLKLTPIFAAIIFVAMLTIATIPAQTQTNNGNTFNDVYFATKFGFQKSLLGTVNVAEGDLRFKHGDGFAVTAAAGANLDFALPFWLSAEIELGVQRYELKELQTGNKGFIRNLSVLWNVRLHPLDIYSLHQIFFGVGLGSSFVEARLAQDQTQNAELSSINFLSQLGVGYDYKLIERSRFSTEYLRVGITARVLFAEGFHSERTAQILAAITYGF